MKKLSQMNLKEGLVATGILSLAISNIMEDKTINGIVSNVKWNEFTTKNKEGNLIVNNNEIKRFFLTKGLTFITKMYGLLAVNYQKDLFDILSVFTEKNVEEVEKMSPLETIKTFKEIFNDEDFLKLFSTVQVGEEEDTIA